jgi:hypothetical protein
MGRVIYKEVRNGDQITVREIHKIVVHCFRLGDVDDPEIYAAEPIWEWQQTDAGKFIMEHSEETPEYHQHIDHVHYGYQYAITAKLEKKKLAEFYLRWGTK